MSDEIQKRPLPEWLTYEGPFDVRVKMPAGFGKPEVILCDPPNALRNDYLRLFRQQGAESEQYQGAVLKAWIDVEKSNANGWDFPDKNAKAWPGIAKSLSTSVMQRLMDAIAVLTDLESFAVPNVEADPGN